MYRRVKMTNLNIAILSPEDLIKYTRPTSPLEVALYDALALAMKDKGQEFDDLTDELNEMEKSLERVNDELSEAQDKIEKLEEELINASAT
jgi:septation ring formation regulator EzrA